MEEIRKSGTAESRCGLLPGDAISMRAQHLQSERSFGNIATVWVTQMGWDVGLRS
jgi:hypothetical protein